VALLKSHPGPLSLFVGFQDFTETFVYNNFFDCDVSGQTNVLK